MSLNKHLETKVLYVCLTFLLIVNIKCNFGYTERRKTIDKCLDNIDVIYRQEILGKHRPNLSYDYIMNHCFNLDKKYLKKDFQIMFSMSKFKKSYDYNLLMGNVERSHASREVKNKFKSISKMMLHKVNNCFNIEKLSSNFFYMKTRSLKSNQEDEKKLSRFYEWLKANGALFDKVDIYIDLDSGMRGMYALEDVKFNENLIYIPEKLVINSERVESNIVSKKIRKYYNQIADFETLILALFVIEQYYNPDSFWKPFIDILPKDLSNFPLFFSEEEINLMQGHRLHKQILKTKERIRKYYDEIICPEAKDLFSVDYCSVVKFDFFMWALLNVKSRAFEFNRKRLEVAGICPLSDLLNHSYKYPSLLWRFSASLKGFVVYGNIQSDSNRELYTSYGHISNEWLLMNYGFTLEENPHNDVWLRITLPPDDKYYYLKFFLLNKKGIKTSKKMPLCINLESIKTMHFLNLFRFVHYQENLNKYLDILYDLKNKTPKQSMIFRNSKTALQVDYLFDNKKDNEEYNFNPYYFTAVDISEEKYLLKKLKELLQESLNDFISTLEEDIQIYEKNKHIMSFNVRNIYTYKITQKQVIHFFIEFCDKMIHLLSFEQYSEFKKYWLKNEKDLNKYHYYIYGTVDYLLSLYKDN